MGWRHNSILLNANLKKMFVILNLFLISDKIYIHIV